MGVASPLEGKPVEVLGLCAGCAKALNVCPPPGAGTRNGRMDV